MLRNTLKNPEVESQTLTVSFLAELKLSIVT